MLGVRVQPQLIYLVNLQMHRYIDLIYHTNLILLNNRKIKFYYHDNALLFRVRPIKTEFGKTRIFISVYFPNHKTINYRGISKRYLW